MRLSEAVKYRKAIEKASAALPDGELLQVPNLAPGWQSTQAYAAGDRVVFTGYLYKCLQEHTAQAAWTPEAASSLWARVLIEEPDSIPQWVQPDSTNPYAKADKVTHNGKVWVSLYDNNSWEPGIFGWEEIS